MNMRYVNLVCLCVKRAVRAVRNVFCFGVAEHGSERDNENSLIWGAWAWCIVTWLIILL